MTAGSWYETAARMLPCRKTRMVTMTPFLPIPLSLTSYDSWMMREVDLTVAQNLPLQQQRSDLLAEKGSAELASNSNQASSSDVAMMGARHTHFAHKISHFLRSTSSSDMLTATAS